MELDKLKSEIKEIADIASSVPEPFREKCFEILLDHLLKGQDNEGEDKSTTNDSEGSGTSENNDVNDKEKLTLQSHVKAFMRRKDISEDQINALVMLEDEELHFIKEPTHNQAYKGQIEWALLTALKNGILNNSLKADPEDIRSIVQDKGYYNAANFAANFKKEKCAVLFKGELERQGDAQFLSKEGETALADLIKSLVGDS